MSDCNLRSLVLYFLRLGATGFGGPVGLANAMRRDLVDARGWIRPDEFEDGLALSAACPGPLAYQLAVYCGFTRFGGTGALSVAIAFALPPFAIVLTAAALYRSFESAWQLRALFYGIAPVIVAIIAKGCWNLQRKTLRTDVRAWAFAVVACLIVVLMEQEIVWLFVGAGLLGIVVFGKSGLGPQASGLGPPPGSEARGPRPEASSGAQRGSVVADLLFFFFKTGLLVFGSGLVIVPFLKAQVVDQYHWLTNQQFLDSVAIGMISPGPVVITATFVGYLLAGFLGAVAATCGIFAAPVLFVLIATPLLRRYRDNTYVRGFVRGIGSAVVGVLVATAWLIARTAIVDWRTLLIAVLALIALAFTKTPEPAVIATAGVIGLLVSV